MGIAEIRRELHALNAREYRAEPVALASDELMAGVEVAVLGDGIVFMPRAAARKAFRDAGSVIEIHVEMEEEEPLPLAYAVQIGLRQAVILLIDARQILLGKAERAVFQYDGLHREDVKPRLVQCEHVLRKVEVLARIGAAQIIVVAAACLDEFAEVAHHDVVRPLSGGIGTHTVMHLAASVRGEDNGDVVVVQPRDIFIREEHPVRRERQLELLAGFLLAFTYILRHFLDRAQIHQRLAAKEIDLTVFARAAAIDDEIDRRAPDLGRHDCAVPAVAAAVAETIFAAQIAVLRDHETEGFHKTARLERRRHVDIGSKERPRRHELMQLPDRLAQLRRRIASRETCGDRLVVRPVEVVHDVVDHLVDDVDSAAVDIDEDMHTVLLELMRSDFHYFSLYVTLQKICRPLSAKGTASPCRYRGAA